MVASNKGKKKTNLLTLTTIKGIMPGQQPETDKEQLKVKDEDDIETPADFVTLGKYSPCSSHGFRLRLSERNVHYR